MDNLSVNGLLIGDCIHKEVIGVFLLKTTTRHKGKNGESKDQNDSTQTGVCIERHIYKNEGAPVCNMCLK